MKRREFISLLSGAVVWPIVARASLRSTISAITALVLAAALGPVMARSPSQAPAQAPAQAPPLGPYKAVAIKLPAALNDPSFDTFRKRLGEIAQRKDRAALAALVAANFFWVPEDVDIADKGKSAIDNMAKALSLDDTDEPGWDALAAYAVETTVMADDQRTGVFCAPAQPDYDEKAADELAKATKTDASDWAFPLRAGIEVRSASRRDAPVVDKLGLYLVRVLADDSPANEALATFLKVLTPSGKVGYVPVDAVREIGAEQLCYVKDAGGWHIAGFLGG
jgi:hypothetical protein